MRVSPLLFPPRTDSQMAVYRQTLGLAPSSETSSFASFSLLVATAPPSTTRRWVGCVNRLRVSFWRVSIAEHHARISWPCIRSQPHAVSAEVDRSSADGRSPASPSVARRLHAAPASHNPPTSGAVPRGTPAGLLQRNAVGSLAALHQPSLAIPVPIAAHPRGGGKISLTVARVRMQSLLIAGAHFIHTLYRI